MTWRDWPVRRQWGRAAMAAVMLVAASGWAASYHVALGVVGAALLIAVTAEVLLPSRYTIDAEGVRIASWVRTRRVRFVQVRGFGLVEDGVCLRGKGPSSWIRRRRTVILRGPSHADAVTSFLESVGVARL